MSEWNLAVIIRLRIVSHVGMAIGAQAGGGEVEFIEAGVELTTARAEAIGMRVFGAEAGIQVIRATVEALPEDVGHA